MPTYSKQTDNGITFCKGDLGPPCANCNWIPDFLCDYPVGQNKTCDRLICEKHANRVSDNVHYCDTHWKMWRDFIISGKAAEVMQANILKFNPPSIDEYNLQEGDKIRIGGFKTKIEGFTEIEIQKQVVTPLGNFDIQLATKIEKK